jgi:hypothetical protein
LTDEMLDQCVRYAKSHPIAGRDAESLTQRFGERPHLSARRGGAECRQQKDRCTRTGAQDVVADRHGCSADLPLEDAAAHARLFLCPEANTNPRSFR